MRTNDILYIHIYSISTRKGKSISQKLTGPYVSLSPDSPQDTIFLIVAEYKVLHKREPIYNLGRRLLIQSRPRVRGKGREHLRLPRITADTSLEAFGGVALTSVRVRRREISIVRASEGGPKGAIVLYLRVSRSVLVGPCHRASIAHTPDLV